MISRWTALLVAVAIAAGCAAPRPAPVVERVPQAKPSAPAPSVSVRGVPADERPDTHVVRRGETLYGIALDNGLDYRDLAEWNGISNPSLIREGQVLRLRPPASPATSDVQVNPVVIPGAVAVRPLAQPQKPESVAPQPQATLAVLKTEPQALRLPYSEQNLARLTRVVPPSAEPVPQPVSAAPSAAAVQPATPPAPPKPAPPQRPAATGDDAIEWSWPASGPLLARFSETSNKGVDIGGRRGEPVYASAGGRVVYSGEGLRGYGKLIIIKHNNTYLSAYAHNDTILVKEGQTVVRGQKIAEIGSTGTDQPKLHFEIRRMGKPVDPLQFLPERPS